MFGPTGNRVIYSTYSFSTHRHFCKDFENSVFHYASQTDRKTGYVGK